MAGGILGTMPPSLLSPVFVGRDAELARLQQALDDAAAGEPVVVVLGGEAGVGKSRLVEELGQRASAAGAQLLVGGCIDLGGDGMAFAPFVAALRDLIRQRGAAQVAGLAGEGAAELGALLPELATPGSSTGRAADGDRGRLYEAVLALLERVAADRPTVLVLEDLHWADRSTRELLAFVARTSRAARLLVLATYRSDDLHRGHPLRPFLAELDRVRAVQRMELPRLTRSDVAAQLAGISGGTPTPDRVDVVFERSEGNPFFVEELSCCTLRTGLPDTLRELLLTRVDRLSRPTQGVIRRASILGTRFGYQLLQAISSESDDALLDALREAVEANLLVTELDADAFAFRHSLLREVLHDDQLPGEHTRLHTRVAEALTERPDLVPADRLQTELAHHWYAAHRLALALPAAYAAAQVAERIFAYAEQLRMLERVLELWDVVPDAGERIDADRFDLVCQTVTAAHRSGDYERAVALSDLAVSMVDPTAEPERAARALAVRGRLGKACGRLTADDDLWAALRLLPEQPATSLRAEVLGSLAHSMALTGQGDEPLALARAAVATAQEAADPVAELSAQSTLGMLLVGQGDVEDGLTAARRSVALAEQFGGQFHVARVLTNMSDTLCGLGRYLEAVEAARAGMAVAREVGLTRSFGTLLLGNEAEPLLLLGRTGEAEQVLEQAFAATPDAGESTFLHRLAADVALVHGDLAAAGASLALARPHLSWGAAMEPLPQYGLPVARVTAELAAAEGDLDRAWLAASEPLAGGLVRSHGRYWWPLLVVAARAAADRAQRARDLRRPDEEQAAIADAGRVAAFAADLPVASPVADAARLTVRAEVARARGADTADDWQQAVDAWDKAAEPRPRARALLWLAERQAAAGDRPAAEAGVRAALDIAQSAEAHLLLDQVRALGRRLRIDLVDAARRRRSRSGRRTSRTPRAAWSPSSGSPPARPRCSGRWPTACPTGRSASGCSSAPRRRACTCPTSWPSCGSTPGERLRRWRTGSVRSTDRCRTTLSPR